MITFTIPTWALPQLINSDFSAITDEEDAKLSDFCSKIVSTYGHCNFGMPESDEYFRWSNDIERIGGDVVELPLIN